MRRGNMSGTEPASERGTEPDKRRLAVVSGGGTGIGRAIAEALLADGDDVLILGRRPEVVAAAAEGMNAVAAHSFGTVSWLAADLAEPRDVRRVGHFVRAQGRNVDVIVANAGAPASRVEGDLEQVEAAWNSAFRANVLTAVLLVHVLEPLLARPGGRVVLVGSQSAVTGGASGPYVAAKSALHGWVLSLAARLGPDGVTANLVSPGYTEGTELVRGRISAQRHAGLVARTALGRAASTMEIAAVVRFVAAREASYLTGQVVAVDGGTLPAG
jgi:3-oxoacyl-[acyl-carrier protein] reductase